MSTNGKISYRSLQHSIHRDIQQIRDITILYDKATLLYEKRDYRRAYIYFDICVTARKDEPRYRLSRGICAFSLNVYNQAYDDAKISMKIKDKMESESTSRELQKQISDKLLYSLMADHRKHISRCKFWMGKAEFEQGDYEIALHEFSESQLVMPSSKAKEMIKLCEERRKQGLASMFYHSASSKCKRLFCDEEKMQNHSSRSNRFPRKYPSMFSVSSLQHPQDSQLPISILGTYAVFEKRSFLEEKARLIQKAIHAQSRDSEIRFNAAFGLSQDDEEESDCI